METKLRSFKYRELGRNDKVRSYSIVFDEDEKCYLFKVFDDPKVYKLKEEDVLKIFDKYQFRHLTAEEAYPFKLKEQIDYKIVFAFFDQFENFEVNGYSHYPDFYNNFIADIAKLIPSKTLSVLKVKDEMLDKDKKYKTNYIEKMNIVLEKGSIVISKDKMNETEYDVDVSVPKLDAYFKKDDLNFVMPINVHYFTYLMSKIFSKNDAIKRNECNENYIDIRFHTKSHLFLSLDSDESIEKLSKLINYLEMFIKIPILSAFVDDVFIEKYIMSHSKPLSKHEVIDLFDDLISKDELDLLQILKVVAKKASNFSMSELVSIAYHQQEKMYVYLIDATGNKHDIIEKLVFSENERELDKLYSPKFGYEVSYIDISKDYDAAYYKDNSGIIHLMVFASRYHDLEFLRANSQMLEIFTNYFKI